MSPFSNPQVMLAAWKRTKAWYSGGEGFPQPDFTEWTLNRDQWLERLSRHLALGTYRPAAMPLVPYPKGGLNLRHYCQPVVRDQTAFMAFAVLLAPVLEMSMRSVSFGNRWYRRPYLDESGERPLWKRRNWSLDDPRPYQPYSRSHGLFRRVASWTVDGMLRRRNSASESTDTAIGPDDYELASIPLFARPEYWTGTPSIEKVFWARLDLKLAFPSVQLRVLRQSIHSLLDVGSLESLAKKTAVHFRQAALTQALDLYGDNLREYLTAPENVKNLADQCLDAIEKIRYDPYPGSDEFCFKESPVNPKQLPFGDGSSFVGLPTGLCISPLLLNVYLHGVDSKMQSWFSGKPSGGYLRFADDVIILANSEKSLLSALDRFVDALANVGIKGADSNLRLNCEKIRPVVLQQRFDEKTCHPVRLSKPAKARISRSLEASAVTRAQNPFVTDLVERLSELGTDNEIDALPENATDRVSRLREIVYFKPDDEAVPRATQLTFAANHLSRTWLPELSPENDKATISAIRDAISESLRGAPEKPRLWRSVIRASIRRSFPGSAKIEEGKIATRWLRTLTQGFSVNSNPQWLLSAKAMEAELQIPTRQWQLFASYHRASFWGAVSETSAEIASARCILEEDKTFPSSNSWLFRAFDEVSLRKACEWLGKQTSDSVIQFYGRNSVILQPWEAFPFATALMSFVSRSIVARFFVDDVPSPSMDFLDAVIELLKRSDGDWDRSISVLKRVAGPVKRRATLRRMLALSRRESNDGEVVAHALKSTVKFPTLLRLADYFHTQRYLGDINDQIIKEIGRFDIESLGNHSVERPWDARLALLRYERARRIWLGNLSKADE